MRMPSQVNENPPNAKSYMATAKLMTAHPANARCSHRANDDIETRMPIDYSGVIAARGIPDKPGLRQTLGT